MTTTKWTADDGPNCRRAGSESVFWPLQPSILLHATAASNAAALFWIWPSRLLLPLSIHILSISQASKHARYSTRRSLSLSKAMLAATTDCYTSSQAAANGSSSSCSSFRSRVLFLWDAYGEGVWLGPNLLSKIKLNEKMTETKLAARNQSSNFV